MQNSVKRGYVHMEILGLGNIGLMVYYVVNLYRQSFFHFFYNESLNGIKKR